MLNETILQRSQIFDPIYTQSYFPINRVWIFSAPNQAYLFTYLPSIYIQNHSNSFYNVSRLYVSLLLQLNFVGHKAKEQISKRWLQENKAKRTNEHFLLPDTHTFAEKLFRHSFRRIAHRNI